MRKQQRRSVPLQKRSCLRCNQPRPLLLEGLNTEPTGGMQMPDVRLFDSRDLRRVLGTCGTGVTVVTTTDDEGGFHGVTANSFSSVSLDPPLILWSQAAKTHSHPVFFKAERFAVNILADDQIELSKRFAKSSKDKFSGVDVDIGSAGVPLLCDCSARLQCRVV